MRITSNIVFTVLHFSYLSVATEPKICNVARLVQPEKEMHGGASDIFQLDTNEDGTVVSIGAYYNRGNQDWSHVNVIYRQPASPRWTFSKQVGGSQIMAHRNRKRFHQALSDDGTVWAVKQLGTGFQVFDYIIGNWQERSYENYAHRSDREWRTLSDWQFDTMELSGDGKTIALYEVSDSRRQVEVEINFWNTGIYRWEVLGGITFFDGFDFEGTVDMSVALNYDGTVVAIAISNVSKEIGQVRVYLYDDVTNEWYQTGNTIETWQIDTEESLEISDSGGTVVFKSTTQNNVVAYQLVKQGNDDFTWFQMGQTLFGPAYSLSGDGTELVVTFEDEFVDHSIGQGGVHWYILDTVAFRWELYTTIHGSDISYYDAVTGTTNGANIGQTVAFSRDGTSLVVGLDTDGFPSQRDDYFWAAVFRKNVSDADCPYPSGATGMLSTRLLPTTILLNAALLLWVTVL